MKAQKEKLKGKSGVFGKKRRRWGKIGGQQKRGDP
jgi:hypothetical protein